MNLTDPFVWYQALFRLYTRLCEEQREVLQDLTMTEDARHTLAGMLAHEWWHQGLPLSEGVVPIQQILAEEVLAYQVEWLLEETTTQEVFVRWTVAQSGWYGARNGPEWNGQEADDATRKIDLNQGGVRHAGDPGPDRNVPVSRVRTIQLTGWRAAWQRRPSRPGRGIARRPPRPL